MATRRITTGLTRTVDNLKALKEGMDLLVSQEVLVGFPDSTSDRKQEDGPITNAALAYIHNTGMPEQNIPARPFMEPAIEAEQERISRSLFSTAKELLKGGGKHAVEQGLIRTGQIAQIAIKRKINSGVPPPLADSTLRQRAARGRKGAKLELSNRAAGLSPSTQLAKPLIDTAQMRNAVNFVVRDRKKRR